MGAQRLTAHTAYVMSAERPRGSGEKLMDRHPQLTAPHFSSNSSVLSRRRTHSCTATTNEPTVFLVRLPGGRRCAPTFPGYVCDPTALPCCPTSSVSFFRSSLPTSPPAPQLLAHPHPPVAAWMLKQARIASPLHTHTHILPTGSTSREETPPSSLFFFVFFRTHLPRHPLSAPTCEHIRGRCEARVWCVYGHTAHLPRTAQRRNAERK